MSRHLVRLFTATLVLSVTSCDDEEHVQEVSPLAPVVVVSPMAALTEATVKVKGSTVCAAYERERVKLLGDLKLKPEDKELLNRASAVAMVITDACN